MTDPSQNLASNQISTDDIPEAMREPSAVSASSTKPKATSSALLVVGAVVVALLTGVGAAIAWRGFPVQIGAQPVAPAQAGLQDALAEVGVFSSSSESPDTLLGHKPYEEAPPSELVSITSDGSLTLRRPAANAFVAMVNAARNDGIYLVPLSGFRSVEQQQYLFFGIREEQTQSASERATVSAPPGYSEHHTGYAVDIGDADKSETNLSERFETTRAFKWLEKNAARYSFELSFKDDESTAVSYEPWHWRYTGDRDSLETFYGSR